jgi:hypothetical protein
MQYISCVQALGSHQQALRHSYEPTSSNNAHSRAGPSSSYPTSALPAPSSSASSGLAHPSSRFSVRSSQYAPDYSRVGHSYTNSSRYAAPVQTSHQSVQHSVYCPRMGLTRRYLRSGTAGHMISPIVDSAKTKASTPSKSSWSRAT